MALPKIESPIFSTTLPTGENIKYRPFTVKEQKNLLIISEGGTEKDIINGIVSLVDTCTFNKIDWLKQPTVNLEHIFLHIRSKSVGEIVEMSYECEECKHKNFIEVDIRNAVHEPFPNTLIKVTDNISIVLDYITIKDVLDSLENNDTLDILYKKTKMVMNGDEAITEFEKDEFKQFIDSFPPDASNRIDEFFLKQPSLILNLKTKCSKCGHETNLEIKGVLNFFG